VSGIEGRKKDGFDLIIRLDVPGGEERIGGELFRRLGAPPGE
jgi:hypothetical protein